jgi:hypothetical protein
MSGNSAKVECRVWDDTATNTIKAAKPNALSINVDKMGTKGSNASGNTTFFTKLGWLITELAD